MRVRTNVLMAALVTFAALGTPAKAVETVFASSYDLSIDLQLLGLVGVSAGPFSSVSGAAPESFALSDSAASVDQTLGLGVLGLIGVRERISTGLMIARAGSIFPIYPNGQARATVNELELALETVLFGLIGNVLTLESGTIESRSSVDGRGSLTAAGSSTIEGLVFSSDLIGAFNIDATAFVNPAPNTVLLDLLGVRITLNEQITTGNGVDEIILTTNAIHIAFNNFAIATGLLTGDIIVASSMAGIRGEAITEVPEPASWLMMIAGFGLVGAAVRRRATRERLIAA